MLKCHQDFDEMSGGIVLGTLWLGKVRTLVSENDQAEAIYVTDDEIVAVGNAEQLKNIYGQSIDKVIDVGPNVIYPGFVDSHLHIMGHGIKLQRLDLSRVASSEDMRKALINKVNQTKAGAWVLGEGWNENNFPDRKIFHVRELDEIAPNNPLVLTRICRHAMLANSKAMAMAGITKHTVNPDGGVIVRDNEGIPTGYLLDQAQNRISDVIPQMTQEELDETCRISIRDLLSLGLVGGHSEDLNSYGGFDRAFNAFRHVIDGEQVRFRANLLVQYPVLPDMAAAGYGVNEGTKYITLGSAKIFSDGALGGRTALLREPYTDSPDTSGVAIHSCKELKEVVKEARQYKMPVAIHAIGDLALEYAIEAIETFPPPAGKRDRLIHAQITPKDLRERMKRLPVVLDIQPQFVSSDFPWVIERLGEKRLLYSFAWKTLLEDGIRCAGGSDAPIEEVNPLLGIYAAVTRRKPMETHEGYLPDQKISVYDAVKLYTVGSAQAISKEEERGLIAPGYTADFTILDKDLFNIEFDDMLKTKVFMTVVDNHVVYKNEEV